MKIIKLNKEQKKYLLQTFFNPYTIYKMFKMRDTDYLLREDQRFELHPGAFDGWWDLYWNGNKVNTIITKNTPTLWKHLLELSKK